MRPSSSDTLIEAKSIGFERDGRMILEAIDFSISRGEIVTLIGPNGGGKTTFARLCLGVLAPDRGEILRADDLTVGYVPQRLKIDRSLPMTVLRFISLRQKAGQEEVAEALAMVGASRLLNTQMADLSGGEMQRVMLARALLHKPDLLVLDEPAQGVDFVGEAALYELISELRDKLNCAVMLISHDLHVVMGSSDRVLCLNGHVCCEGVPEQVSHHPEYERLFGPERAAAYGIYTHKHDHEHSLSGDVCCDHEHNHDASSRSDKEPLKHG